MINDGIVSFEGFEIDRRSRRPRKAFVQGVFYDERGGRILQPDVQLIVFGKSEKVSGAVYKR